MGQHRKSQDVERILPHIVCEVNEDELLIEIRRKIRSRGHLLVNKLNGIHLHCRNCKWDHPKSDLSFWENTGSVGTCSVSMNSSQVQAHILYAGPRPQFVGLVSDYTVLKDAIASRNKSILAGSRAALKGAYKKFSEQCSLQHTLLLPLAFQLVDPTGAKDKTGDRIAPWMLDLHPSHQYWVAGGLICLCSVWSIPVKV